MNEVLARLETQMAVLARRIENAARQSTTFQRMDRAAYLIARTLDDSGPSSVNEIARSLALDGSTVTRQVAAMEVRGHATRKTHPVDGRAWVISLTASGRKEMESIGALRRARFAEMMADWSEADIDTFGQLLQRFNDVLATSAPITPPDASATEDPPPGRRSEHRKSVLSPRRTR